MTREQVKIEARSWVDTPYIMRGQVKHAGVDCATLLICVFRNCGMEIEDHEFLSGDWFCHISDERYLRHIMKYCRKLLEKQCFRSLDAQTGDILTVRAAGCHFYNHGAIITDWPLAVHAISPCVREIDVSRDPMWATEPVAVWSPF